MPSTGPRVKNWCFSLFHYTLADLNRLSSQLDDVVFLIYTRKDAFHLQGTVCFQSRKRRSQVMQVISVRGQAHCTATQSLLKSIEYCKKDGDFIIVTNRDFTVEGGCNRLEPSHQFKATPQICTNFVVL